MYIYTLVLLYYNVSGNFVQRFQMRWQTVLSRIFHFGQISKFKKSVTPKKNWIKITCGYAHLHIICFITSNFYEILLSGFRGVALTRKTGLTNWRTDWLTDWRTDGSKTLYPPTRCVGYKKIPFTKGCCVPSTVENRPISPWKGYGSLFDQNWIHFIQGCFMPNWVEIVDL